MEEVPPWWDVEALRLVEGIEKSIVRLHLDSQGEFIAILNAILMQLESQQTVPGAVALLVDSLRVLAAARGIEPHHRRHLDQRLDELVQRLTTP